MAICGYGIALRAAIFQQECSQAVQGSKISPVNDLPPTSLPIEQSCDGQGVQMKGERGGWKTKLFRDATGRRALRSLANQEPDNVKPGFLGQGRQALNYC